MIKRKMDEDIDGIREYVRAFKLIVSSGVSYRELERKVINAFMDRDAIGVAYHPADALVDVVMGETMVDTDAVWSFMLGGNSVGVKAPGRVVIRLITQHPSFMTSEFLDEYTNIYKPTDAKYKRIVKKMFCENNDIKGGE